MYGQPEWDGDRNTIQAFFDLQFPPALFFVDQATNRSTLEADA